MKPVSEIIEYDAKIHYLFSKNENPENCMTLDSYKKKVQRLLISPNGDDSIVSPKTYRQNKKKIDILINFIRNPHNINLGYDLAVLFKNPLLDDYTISPPDGNNCMVSPSDNETYLPSHYINKTQTSYSAYKLDSLDQYHGVSNPINKDFTWKCLHEKMFYNRLALFLSYNETKSFSFPSYLYPLIYSLIACLNKEKEGWQKLKTHILKKIKIFFQEYDFSSELKPFSEKNIFSIYKYLLDCMFPNELYELSILLQDVCYNTQCLDFFDRLNLLSTLDLIPRFSFKTTEGYKIFYHQYKMYIEQSTTNSLKEEALNPHTKLCYLAQETKLMEEELITPLLKQFKHKTNDVLLGEI